MTPAELRGALAGLGLSHAQAARRMRVAPGQLAEWLSGTSAVPGPVAALIEAWQAHRINKPPAGTAVGDDRDDEAIDAIAPVMAAVIEESVRLGWAEPEAVMAALQVVVERMIAGLGHSAAMAAMQETIGLVRRELH
jgi:hypothetical protein